LPNQSKTPENCGFPLANPQSYESLDVVPQSNLFNQLILLCICPDNTQSGVSGINRDNSPYRAIGGALAPYDL
jgi:hypothetical protein